MNLRSRILPENIDNYFSDIAELILLMTEENPDQRISLDEVHEFIEIILDDCKVSFLSLFNI